MEFNDYIWNLYKGSTEGKATIHSFSPDAFRPEADKRRSNMLPVSEKEYREIIDSLYCYGLSDCDVPQTREEAEELFANVIDLGITEEGNEWLARKDYRTALGLIEPMSCALYIFCPEFFTPYFFIGDMYRLNAIDDAFGMELPEIPVKADYRGRCMYYWRFCEVVHGFRTVHGMSPAEACALLYGFSPKVLPQGETNTGAKPYRAWLIGGKIQDRDRLLLWQTSQDTGRGDILVHYETAPVSAITHIWIAQTDGIEDPIFHYYGYCYIGNRIDIPHITLKELKSHPYFSNHPLVRKNFQGVNGVGVSGEDYSAILHLLNEKGCDVSRLPQIYTPKIPRNLNIQKERDVEMLLLEPMLNSMGWKDGKDYIRQLPIHAGRGHRVFPDYALHYTDKPDEESATVLIEAKFYMKNNKDVEAAFLQARSYAMLLNSSVIVLCDKVGLIVYGKNGSFDRARYKKYYWEEMESPDIFNDLKMKLQP